MFYITELVFRFKYLFLSCLFLIIILFINLDYLFLLFIQPIFKNTYLNWTDFYFIYTNPMELYFYYGSIFLLLLVFFFLPVFIWQIQDFLKSSLYLFEYINLKQKYALFLFYFLFLNISFTLFFLPKIWCFLEFINYYIINHQAFNIFLELKVNEYFFLLVNTLVFLNFSFLLLISYIYFLIAFNIKNLLFFKKLFIFINLILATLISPPEVFSQLLFLVFLTLFLEFLIFLIVINLKKLKYFNKVKY